KAMEALIDAWKEKGVQHPEDQLILSGTVKDAASLNRMVQEERKKAGRLFGEGVSIPGSNETLYKGDRVLFTQKSRLYDVENGSLGDVVAVDIEKKVLTVRLDEGDKVRFSLDDYTHVKPGYAMTTHKGQGETTEWSYVLVGGSLQD